MAEPNTDQDASITASLYFLARRPIYDSEKPFTLRYDPGNSLPASNVESEEHEVEIRNMRLHEFSYEKCGFQWCRVSSSMEYSDYSDDNIIQQKHFPEVKACLKKALGASLVEIIDLAVSQYIFLPPISRSRIVLTRFI